MTSQTYKTAAVSVPQNKEDCASAIAELARIRASIDLRQTALDESIAAMTANTEAQIAPLRDKYQVISVAVQSYCEARKKELLKGKAKSHKFTTGVVGWKSGTVVIEIEKGKEADIVSALKLRKQTAALKHTIAIKKDVVKGFSADLLAKIPGLSKKVNPDTFYIKPHAIVVDREADRKEVAA